MFSILGCNNDQKISENKFTDKKEYYVLRGMNYSENKDYEKALQELKKAYAKDPSDLLINREMGYCYSALGNYEKGEDYYKKVLAINSEDTNALKNLAYIYYMQNKIFLSQENINFIPINNQDDYVKKLQGYIFIKNNEDEKAYNYLKKEMNEGKQFDLYLYKEYFLLLGRLNKKDELSLILEKKYGLFSNEKEYIKLYVETLDKIFNNQENGKKVIKRYLINDKDNELLFKLVELNIKTEDYEEAKIALSFINEDEKLSDRYINLEQNIYKELDL